MYILLTGKHPLYNQKDTTKTYVAKIANPSFTFPSTFSEWSSYKDNIMVKLVRDFFLRVCNMDVQLRYTASTALAHP